MRRACTPPKRTQTTQSRRVATPTTPSPQAAPTRSMSSTTRSWMRSATNRMITVPTSSATTDASPLMSRPKRHLRSRYTAAYARRAPLPPGCRPTLKMLVLQELSGSTGTGPEPKMTAAQGNLSPTPYERYQGPTSGTTLPPLFASPLCHLHGLWGTLCDHTTALVDWSLTRMRSTTPTTAPPWNALQEARITR